MWDYQVQQCSRKCESRKGYERMRLRIKLEFTATNISEQSGGIERAFVTTYNWLRALFIKINLNQEPWNILWAEAVNTEICLDVIMKNENQGHISLNNIWWIWNNCRSD